MVFVFLYFLFLAMIKVKEFKEPQQSQQSIAYLTPKMLSLPVSQHIGSPATPCVKKTDTVKEGDLIAKISSFISASIHAPTNGKITDITNENYPAFKNTFCINIKCEEPNNEYIPRTNINSLSSAQVLDIIKNSGIVGMGGAGFPTHIKLNPPKKINTLLINGCECEPYLSSDCRLMIERTKEIFKGIAIIQKLINPKNIIFAVEANKPEAIKKINLLLSLKKIAIPNLRLKILESKYPQGGEKQLIFNATGCKIPPKKIPADIGCLVHNVATVFAIYEAVYLKKPLIERLVCFCGDALHTPKNIWVKIGTTLRELFNEKVLEFTQQPKRIISGGPLMGLSLDSLDYPILKNNGGFLFLKSELPDTSENPCIRCARCVDTCPMNLLPMQFVKLTKQQDYSKLNQFYIADCIECGCCAYICPAKIPIVHYTKVGKAQLRKTNNL